MPERNKYIFLYLKTGGGHLAPARSLTGYIQCKHSEEIEPVLVDGFESTPGYFRYIIEDGYRKLQAGAQWYYEFLYALNKIPLIARLTALLISLYCKRHIEKVILREKPVKIVILHFFLIKPVFTILRKHKLSIKTTTIVTDPFTAHPLWFMEKGQNYVVFSERLKYYVQKKVSYGSIRIFPFILDEKYSHTLPEENILALKKKLGFPENKKVILILGGGDGIPHGKKILHEILEADINAVIAVVCGRNKKLFRIASELQTMYGKDKFMVYGFIDFVYELLNVSHLVVSKCGASTMMEILLMAKVPVVNNYIWEQEKGNIEFLINNNFGIYQPQIKKLSGIISKLINDEVFYDSFRKNILNAGLKNGTAEVAEFLLNS